MKSKIVKMSNEQFKIILNSLESYDDFWNEKIFEDEFNNENSSYFVICDNDNVDDIYGFGGLWFNIDEAHVMNIAIKKDFRRKHFGYELLNFLIQYAITMKKECITLEVREDNLPAIKLYQKTGFIEMGSRPKYYNNKFDAIIMTKKF